MGRNGLYFFFRLNIRRVAALAVLVASRRISFIDFRRGRRPPFLFTVALTMTFFSRLVQQRLRIYATTRSAFV